MTMTAQLGLCESCRELKTAAYTDPIGRQYCLECYGHLPVATAARIVEQLMVSIPFRVGERVECRTAGVLYDGTGVIDDISVDPEHFGTPAHPSFHVVIDHPAYPEAPDACWFMERQLKRVNES